MQDLLRASANGRLGLFVRLGGVKGDQVPLSALELDDPAMGSDGGFVVPGEAACL